MAQRSCQWVRETQKGRERILGVYNLGITDVLDHAIKAAESGQPEVPTLAEPTV